jgi:hypothetical protein
VCGYECGIGDMITKSNNTESLLHPIKQAAAVKLAEANDRNIDTVEMNSRKGVLTGLTDGTLDNSTHVCISCHKHLKKGKVPPSACIAGSWQGLIPIEVQCNNKENPNGLNSVEQSMISIFNTIAFFKMLPKGPMQLHL